MSQKTYRIGEAAAKLNLKSYVLRFWETEFPQIAPIRTEKGQRLYTESDLSVLGRIRYLLHERGLTIDGARRLLREEAARGVVYAPVDASLPEGMETLPDDEAMEDDHPDADAPPAGHGEAQGPVQGSLFPAGNAARDPAAENEMRFILTELAAIHRLLVRDISGDTP